MRILAIGITFCLVFYTVCVSDQNDYDADDLTADDATKAFELLRSLEERATVNGDQNDYDAGIAAYKRGHYSVALSNFETRAMEGNSVAQFCLGFMYKNHGEIIVTDRKLTENQRETICLQETEKWYTRAADQGYAPAQNNLGVMYVRKYESEGNRYWKTRAVEWFLKAADQNYLPAQNNLGVIGYERLKYWKQAASQGYAPSQRRLGYMYHEGEGVKQNFTEAVKWHIKAAEQGDSIAQHNLGLCYANGLGVKKDLKAAFRYFEKAAAARDYAGGKFQVAKAYQYGWGTDKNLEEALKWYKKAAEQNHRGAQNNLAALYSEGETVLSITDTGEGNSERVIIPQNLELARRWMLRAAQQGHPIPQKNIADNFAR